MKKNEICVKCKIQTVAVANLLSDMAACLNEGKILIQNGSLFTTLQPVEPIELELKTAIKEGKQKIEIQLSWKKEIISKLEDEIRISSDEPCENDALSSKEQTERDSILSRKW